jgi:hypothetical protein
MPNAETSSTPNPVSSKPVSPPAPTMTASEAAARQLPATTPIASLASLQTMAPTMYNDMLKAIASNIMIDLQKSETTASG